MTALLEARGLTKRYPLGDGWVEALVDVDLEVERGDYLAVMGPSGSGKSTLLHVLGCLHRPTRGSYRIDGDDVAGLDDRELSRMRNLRIGFVFQTFNLVPELTVLENVELPFLYGPESGGEATRRATEAIERVGLGERVRHLPSQLSGGEMQRVAIARALAVRPSVVLADEPTGNLDSATSDEILGLFDNLHADGVTLVVVTHDDDVARRARAILRMRDGRFVTPAERGGAST